MLPVRVSQEAHDAFKKALTDSGSERWFELETQDSDVHIDLSQVVYVRLDTEVEHRVGFRHGLAPRSRRWTSGCCACSGRAGTRRASSGR